MRSQALGRAPTRTGLLGIALSTPTVLLQPGTLWPAVATATRRALARGALRPIATEQEEIEDGGIRFVLRRVSNLARKAEFRARGQAVKSADPFLPYDPMLFVAHASPTHSLLLNKFPVLDHHLLIVTRAFEHQETLLDSADFAALAACMAEFEALGFYNSGREAGASQEHKHLQLVPLPLASGRAEVPIERLLRHAQLSDVGGTIPNLPFRHAYAALTSAIWARPELAGELLTAIYRDLCPAARIGEREREGERRQSGPYNLLLTREWMLLVPRSREHYASISVNALGFAGSLFVKDKAQLERVRDIGPMRLLREVSVPA
jgi:sulfate adenylyltransferase (ADP) / ATP adenylyltransferase